MITGGFRRLRRVLKTPAPWCENARFSCINFGTRNFAAVNFANIGRSKTEQWSAVEFTNHVATDSPRARPAVRARCRYVPNKLSNVSGPSRRCSPSVGAARQKICRRLTNRNYRSGSALSSARAIAADRHRLALGFFAFMHRLRIGHDSAPAPSLSVQTTDTYGYPPSKPASRPPPRHVGFLSSIHGAMRRARNRAAGKVARKASKQSNHHTTAPQRGETMCMTWRNARSSFARSRRRCRLRSARSFAQDRLTSRFGALLRIGQRSRGFLRQPGLYARTVPAIGA